MNARFVILALATAALLAPGGAACGAETSSDSEVAFEKWGFKLSLPKEARKQSSEPAADEELREVYIADGLAYVIKITRTPPNYLASTAIEQAIQADMKSGAELGEVRRWELYARSGELYKGLSRIARPDECAVGAAPFLSELVKADTVFESVAMAPLGDESSPILTLGVVGPLDRERDIENQARFLAFSVAKIQRSSPTSKALPTEAHPEKPAPPKAPRALKKGDIELRGSVASVAQDKKSLVMTVTSVRMPGGEPVKLDPPRSKRVFLKQLPDNVRAGTSILVIGRNDGVGMPILADILEIQENGGAPNAHKS